MSKKEVCPFCGFIQNTNRKVLAVSCKRCSSCYCQKNSSVSMDIDDCILSEEIENRLKNDNGVRYSMDDALKILESEN